MKKFYTYILLDLDNKPFYVGKGSKSNTYDRINYHLNHWMDNPNPKLRAKIENLGGKFLVEIAFVSDNEEECLQKEIEYISELGRHNLCNLTNGGQGISGWQHSNKSKQKMKDSKQSYKYAEIAKSNLKKAVERNYGRRKAESYGVLDLYKTKSIRQIGALTGLSFKTIKKFLVERGVYEKNKNRQKISDVSRLKVSEGQLRRVRKRVEQVDVNGVVIVVWANAAHAAKHIAGDIRACLSGRQKTAGGYFWRYED